LIPANLILGKFNGCKIINIPDLGEAEDVEVIEVCAKVGDQVESEDPIIVLESDKAAMEIPASVIGKVISIEVSVGDTVSSGSPFLKIEVSDDAVQKALKKFLMRIKMKKIRLSLKKKKRLNLSNHLMSKYKNLQFQYK
jgi:pyruvate/2-oxoglutarate dehydrogenase complex dihydrolipoamide acyltransferase (E2) component